MTDSDKRGFRLFLNYRRSDVDDQRAQLLRELIEPQSEWAVTVDDTEPGGGLGGFADAEAIARERAEIERLAALPLSELLADLDPVKTYERICDMAAEDEAREAEEELSRQAQGLLMNRARRRVAYSARLHHTRAHHDWRGATRDTSHTRLPFMGKFNFNNRHDFYLKTDRGSIFETPHKSRADSNINATEADIRKSKSSTKRLSRKLISSSELARPASGDTNGSRDFVSSERNRARAVKSLESIKYFEGPAIAMKVSAEALEDSKTTIVSLQDHGPPASRDCVASHDLELISEGAVATHGNATNTGNHFGNDTENTVTSGAEFWNDDLMTCAAGLVPSAPADLTYDGFLERLSNASCVLVICSNDFLAAPDWWSRRDWIDAVEAARMRSALGQAQAAAGFMRIGHPSRVECVVVQKELAALIAAARIRAMPRIARELRMLLRQDG